jgi:Na+-translocating ferredoxin:NAD+ oxidoreductase subunit B
VSPTESLVEALNDALPQTQCTRCGYADCRGYAQAIVTDAAAINQCPPGGSEGVSRLAALTGRTPLPLNPANGREGPRLLAVIDEAWCIGCTLCLQACPVDCIVGAPKAMHTVIDSLCTGCELCIPVCPVDCIALLPATGRRTGWQAWSAAQATESRQRYAAHRSRLDAETPTEADPNDERRRAAIDAALARARETRMPR